jgi:hypothetical protein
MRTMRTSGENTNRVARVPFVFLREIDSDSNYSGTMS